MRNDGIAYELFVQRVQQALINAQQLGNYRTINVQHNLKLVDKNGNMRQFDLYWEFELGGHTYRNVIECKDYVNDIPVDKVDAFAGKLKGFPDLKGIIATRNGYQSGSIQQAKANGIEVMIVRDEDPSRDWVDSDGTPLLRSIVLNINCIVPAAVLGVNFTFDKAWAKVHGIAEIHYNAPANEIFVNDVSKGERLNLQQIVENDSLQHNSEDRSVHHAVVTGLIDAYLELSSGLKVKLLGYDLSYRPGYILKDELKIEPEVLGVVELINERKKKLVLKQGNRIAVVNRGIEAKE